MAFKMKGWGGFQMKSPMKQGAKNPSKDIPLIKTNVEQSMGEQFTTTFDPDEDKAEHIFGQEIEVVGDNKYQIDVEDLGYGITGLPEGQDVVEILDPDGILGNKKEGEYVADEDYTWEVKDGKVIITGERVLEPGE